MNRHMNDVWEVAHISQFNNVALPLQRQPFDSQVIACFVVANVVLGDTVSVRIEYVQAHEGDSSALGHHTGSSISFESEGSGKSAPCGHGRSKRGHWLDGASQERDHHAQKHN